MPDNPPFVFMVPMGDRLQTSKDHGSQQSAYECDGVTIHALRFSTCTQTPHVSSHVCYVGQTEAQKGKFDTQKALELGIPKGPLYGKLKNGHSITLDNGVTVTPDQVLGPAESSRYFVIVCNMEAFCDSLLADVTRHEFLNRFCAGGDLWNSLDCLIHLSPDHVVHSPTYQSWMQQFDLDVHHILVSSSSCKQSSFVAATLNSRKLHRTNPSLFAAVQLFRPSPPNSETNLEGRFVATVTGVPEMEYRVLPSKRRGFEMRPVVGPTQQWEELDQFWASFLQSSIGDDGNVSDAQSDLRRMVAAESYVHSAEYVTDMEARHTKKLAHVDEALHGMSLLSDASAALLNSADSRLLFLGTGCAVPSKYRNVSGILLQLASTNSSMLLDAGEGTWSQLLRMGMTRPDLFGEAQPSPSSNPCDSSSFDGRQEADIALKIAMQLKAVWISHPHADHHLGLLTVIAERKKLITRYREQLLLANCSEHAPLAFEPLLVVAPPSILLFLQENVSLNSELDCAFICLSTRQLDPYDACETSDFFWPAAGVGSSRYYQPEPVSEECKAAQAAALANAESVFSSMGLRSVVNIQVTHCKQSFGLIVEGRADVPFKLVYSGDTRPCELLIKHGFDATILIHEATFEDDKLHEAVAKRHSTLGEALDVGADMRAHRVILTHFSQRYPSMPQISTVCAVTAAADLPYSRRVPLTGRSNSCNFIVAFDFMHVSFRDLIWAPTVTAVLQRAFPVVSAGGGDEAEDEEIGRVVELAPQATKSKLNKKVPKGIPGAFAVKDCTCCDQNSSQLLAQECALHIVFRGKRKAEEMIGSL
eukprot:gene21677-27718_t